MKKGSLLIIVLIFLTASIVAAAGIEVLWNDNTEDDLASYKVYYAGPDDPGWILDGGRWSYTLQALPHSIETIDPELLISISFEGPYAIGVTAIDKAGNESELSDIKTTYYQVPQVIQVPEVDVPPGAPVQVIINIKN